MLKDVKDLFFLLFLIQLLIIQSHTNAQINPYQHFSIEEGILSTNIFDIDQDPKGYIWFATDIGLSRFDGVKFLNISNKELGINSFISSIVCLNSDTIIFGCGVNGIYHFDVRKRKARQLNNSAISQSNKLVTKDDLIISIHDYHTIEVISTKSRKLLKTDTILSKTNLNYPLTINKTHDGIILIGRSDGVYQFDTKNLIQEKVLSDLITSPVYSIYKHENGTLFIGSENTVYKVFNGKLIDEIKFNFKEESRIRNIAIDKNEKMWFSLWGGTAIYIYDKKSLTNVNQYSNINVPGISRFLKDFDGNLWVGTTGKGLFLFKNHFIINYPTQIYFPNSNVRKITKVKGGLLLGSADGIGLYSYLNDSIYYTKHMFDYGQYVRDICEFDENNYVVAITDLRFRESLRKSYFVNDSLSVRYVHSSSLYNYNGELYTGNWDGEIYKYVNGETLCLTFDSIPPANIKNKRIDAIYIDKYNTIWTGGQYGLCLIDEKLRKRYLINSITGTSALKIEGKSDNRIEVLTNTGLKVYKASQDILKVNIIDSITLFNVTTYVDCGNDLYAFGSNEGIYLYQNQLLGKLTVFDGLISESINDLYYDVDSKILYAASAEGLIKVNLPDAINYFNVKYNVNDIVVKVDDEVLNDDNGVYTYSYSDRPVIVILRSLSYANSKEINYRARINNGDFQILEEGLLRLFYLKPGIHQIEFSAGINGSWGKNAIITLNIIPPFYMTKVFYLSVLSVLLFLAIFIFYRVQETKRVRFKKDKETFNLLNEYKQKALSSNLNPHFVFNALNSVQNYINKSDGKSANEYLTLFARLIRTHINYNDHGLIKLSNEIERLEMYLNFERIRLSHSFNYNLIIDIQLHEFEILFPSMILQPFIENAIWHGFAELKEGGEISIHMEGGPGWDERRERVLKSPIIITITDNGSGIQPGRPSKHGYESMGVQLVRERLLNLDPGCTDPITFQDHNPGTKVIIQLSEKVYQMGAGQA